MKRNPSQLQQDILFEQQMNRDKNQMKKMTRTSTSPMRTTTNNPFFKQNDNQNGVIIQGTPTRSPLKQLNTNQVYAASQPNLPPSTFTNSKNQNYTGRMSQGVSQGQAQRFYPRSSHQQQQQQNQQRVNPQVIQSFGNNQMQFQKVVPEEKMLYKIEKPVLKDTHTQPKREVTPQNTIVYENGEEPFENGDIQTQLTDQGIIITQQDYNVARTTMQQPMVQQQQTEINKSNYSAFTQVQNPQQLMYQGENDEHLLEFNNNSQLKYTKSQVNLTPRSMNSTSINQRSIHNLKALATQGIDLPNQSQMKSQKSFVQMQPQISTNNENYNNLNVQPSLNDDISFNMSKHTTSYHPFGYDGGMDDDNQSDRSELRNFVRNNQDQQMSLQYSQNQQMNSFQKPMHFQNGQNGTGIDQDSEYIPVEVVPAHESIHQENNTSGIQFFVQNQ